MSIRRTAPPSSGGPSGSGGGFWTALAAWSALAVSLANLALLFHFWNRLPAEDLSEGLNGWLGRGEKPPAEQVDEGWQEPVEPEPVAASRPAPVDTLQAQSPPPREETAAREPAKPANQPAPESARSTIRLQVQNGSGVRLMAAKAADGLRRLRYDVRETGNANSDLDKTRIISRVQDPAPSLRLAQDLGLSSARISYAEDPMLVDVDVTLILGADYHKLPIMGTR
ncbi:MAG: LytR C-terminal domain-containing protein [Candidatus Delongbacteria bacterium]